MLDVHFYKRCHVGFYRFKTPKAFLPEPGPTHLVSFTVTVKETDLSVCADKALETDVRELVFQQRNIIESFIEQYPDFLNSLRLGRS